MAYILGKLTKASFGFKLFVPVFCLKTKLIESLPTRIEDKIAAGCTGLISHRAPNNLSPQPSGVLDQWTVIVHHWPAMTMKASQTVWFWPQELFTWNKSVIMQPKQPHRMVASHASALHGLWTPTWPHSTNVNQMPMIGTLLKHYQFRNCQATRDRLHECSASAGTCSAHSGCSSVYSWMARLWRKICILLPPKFENIAQKTKSLLFDDLCIMFLKNKNQKI